MTSDIKDLQKRQPKKGGFPAMLQQFKGEIERALPRHLNGDRMARIALTAFRLNPKLAECDPASVFASVIQASQLGLEPNTRGRSFLVPYGRECQFIPGWMGLVELMNRAKSATVWTGAVFDGDDFDWALGDSPFVRHRPAGEYDEDKLTHVYAVGRVSGAEWPVIEIWPIERVRKHRDRYNKVGGRHYSYQNWEMYARKVVLLQVLKYLPSSAELDQAVALNDAAETGSQHLTVPDAIEGTWTPGPIEDVEEEQGGAGAEQQASSGETWPKRITDPETGEEMLVDAGDNIFDPAKFGVKHGTKDEPSMTADGKYFRKRRQVRKQRQEQPPSTPLSRAGEEQTQADDEAPGGDNRPDHWGDVE